MKKIVSLGLPGLSFRPLHRWLLSEAGRVDSNPRRRTLLRLWRSGSVQSNLGMVVPAEGVHAASLSRSLDPAADSEPIIDASGLFWGPATSAFQPDAIAARAIKQLCAEIEAHGRTPQLHMTLSHYSRWIADYYDETVRNGNETRRLDDFVSSIAVWPGIVASAAMDSGHELVVHLADEEDTRSEPWCLVPEYADAAAFTGERIQHEWPPASPRRLLQWELEIARSWNRIGRQGSPQLTLGNSLAALESIGEPSSLQPATLLELMRLGAHDLNRLRRTIKTECDLVAPEHLQGIDALPSLGSLTPNACPPNGTERNLLRLSLEQKMSAVLALSFLGEQSTSDAMRLG